MMLFFTCPNCGKDCYCIDTGLHDCPYCKTGCWVVLKAEARSITDLENEVLDGEKTDV